MIDRKADVLVVAPLVSEHMTRLLDSCTAHRYDLTADRDGLLSSVGGAIRAVITSGALGFSQALLSRLPMLELVASMGTGVDNIDTAACRARGVHVTNTPNVQNDDVADLGIGLIIALLRRLPAGHEHVRSGEWARSRMPLTSAVTGKTLGIVGLGRIGHALAARAEALKMKIAYFGRHRQAVPYAYFASAAELAGHADVLALTCPGGESTRGLVGSAELAALGPNGWLVNLARGSVVDEPALISALQTRQIAGAALDAFAHEPDIDARLRVLPNVILSPHNASGTVETRQAMSLLVLENLVSYFSTGRLITPIGQAPIG